MRTARLVKAAMVLGIPSALYLCDRADAWGPHSFLQSLRDAPSVTVSTVPTTGAQAGDQNPYGVAVVSFDSKALKQGDILVSNFNGAANLQGTGSTIVSIDPRTKTQSVFFDAKSPIGLTTALVALKSGFVVVGSAPRVDAAPPTVGNGSLIFLEGEGNVVLQLTDSALLDGPWDATVSERDPDEPRLFVSNVLSGTVVRVRLRVRSKAPRITVESITRIASGFATRTDPSALVIGPTGLALDERGSALFVADTGNNRIAVIDADVEVDQGNGSTVFAGPPLAGPLGLVHVPQLEHLVAVNGDSVSSSSPNQAVEINERGMLVATRTLDDSGTAGGLFGITLTHRDGELSLVFVDDNSNTVNLQKTR